MKTITAILFLIGTISLPLFSQGEIDDEEKIFYRNEKTYAFTLNSNGLGANFRYARRVNAFKKTIYEVGLNMVKHQKEIKISISNSQQLGGSFVYGKLNSLTTLHGGIGMQKEIFRKEDKGGISIRYFYAFGPSIGFQKPVYYDVIVYEEDSQGVSIQVRKRMKFESHIIMIERRAPFYVGFKELSIVPGAYGKFGFTFEFSKSDASFNAIETGIVVDTFIKKVPIMANEQNHWIYPAFFLSYRFGRIVDAQFKTKSNKIDEILID